jgi:multiple sugar transport system substrate-binding protein
MMVVGGCTSPTAQNDNEQRRKIKIMFWNESFFNQEYGEFFSMKYPNTDIEIVSTNSLYDGSEDGEEFDFEKALAKFIDKEQPDVLLLSNPESIQKLSADGKLAELQPLIDSDKYDMATYSQGILESIREMGGGKLFALAPKFTGKAIIYNADLFKKHGVELPRDGMTWQEVFDTARLFPTDGTEKERVYGYWEYQTTTLNDLASSIANTQGLKFYDSKTKKITMNTDSWKSVYKMVADAVQSKAVFTDRENGLQSGGMEDVYVSQPFIMGRAAMTVGSSDIIARIQEAVSNVKDYKSFEIGVASGPVNPLDPTQAHSANLSGLFAIRAGSPNAEAAWDFIKFVNSEEFAKVNARNIFNGFLTREGISKEYNGVSLEAFYKLKPKLLINNNNIASIPDDFYTKYLSIFKREVNLVEENKKTVDEALDTAQSEAQFALDQAFKDQESKKESNK